MVDTRTPNQRRRIMQSIRAKNTAPEHIIRRLVHGLGFRFRLHRRDLPGKPDLVLPRLRKVIFVNGCFWYGHEGCKKGELPKSRTEYWEPKIARTKQRDVLASSMLNEAGWEVLTIWECETIDPDMMHRRLTDFL